MYNPALDNLVGVNPIFTGGNGPQYGIRFNPSDVTGSGSGGGAPTGGTGWDRWNDRIQDGVGTVGDVLCLLNPDRPGCNPQAAGTNPDGTQPTPTWVWILVALVVVVLLITLLKK